MITLLNIIMLIVSALLSFFVLSRFLGAPMSSVVKWRVFILALVLSSYFGFSRASVLFQVDVSVPTSVSLVLSVLLLLLFSHILFKKKLMELIVATVLTFFFSMITEILTGILYMVITQKLPNTPQEYLVVTCLNTVITLGILVVLKNKLTTVHRGVLRLLTFSKEGHSKVIIGQIILGSASVFLMTISIVDLLKGQHSSYTLMGLWTLFIILIFGFNYIVLHEILGDKVKLARLEQETIYTDAYSLVIEDVKAYWHNHANILDTLKICLYAEDVSKEEMVQVISEYVDWSSSSDIANKVKLTQLSHPILAGVVKLKYDYANELGVKLTLNSHGSASIHMNMVEFTEVVGVLLDNAIEVASLAGNPVVDVDVILDNVFSIRILNFVKTVDNHVLKRGVSRGIGLKTVENILQKYPAAHLDVTNTDTYYDVLLTIGG